MSPTAEDPFKSEILSFKGGTKESNPIVLYERVKQFDYFKLTAKDLCEVIDSWLSIPRYVYAPERMRSDSNCSEEIQFFAVVGLDNAHRALTELIARAMEDPSYNDDTKRHDRIQEFLRAADICIGYARRIPKCYPINASFSFYSFTVPAVLKRVSHKTDQQAHDDARLIAGALMYLRMFRWKLERKVKEDPGPEGTASNSVDHKENQVNSGNSVGERVRQQILRTVLELQGSGNSYVGDQDIAQALELDIDDVTGHLDIIRSEGTADVVVTSSGYSAYLRPGQRQRVKESEMTAAKTHASNPDSRRVLVVHGRNAAARDALFELLRAINLQPLEWDMIVARTGAGSPYTGQVLDAGFEQARAVVVALTPDDVARLQTPFHTEDDGPQERNLTPQARPNVLIEAGMALRRDARRTVIVQFGKVREVSDLAGRNVIHMQDTASKRKAIADRLKTAGCDVDISGNDWLKAGDFRKALELAQWNDQGLSSVEELSFPAWVAGTWDVRWGPNQEPERVRITQGGDYYFQEERRFRLKVLKYDERTGVIEWMKIRMDLGIHTDELLKIISHDELKGERVDMKNHPVYYKRLC